MLGQNLPFAALACRNYSVKFESGAVAYKEKEPYKRGNKNLTQKAKEVILFMWAKIKVRRNLNEG
jgi:hypothetical protein